jgi:hypothetical protein
MVAGCEELLEHGSLRGVARDALVHRVDVVRDRDGPDLGVASEQAQVRGDLVAMARVADLDAQRAEVVARDPMSRAAGRSVRRATVRLSQRF